MEELSPAALRQKIRAGEWDKSTSGMCLGYQQANLVIMPKAQATEFEAFCKKNSAACPLLAVLAPGETEPKALAKGADVRTDLPRYRVWRNGELAAEVTDIKEYFTEDMVSFFLGCSFGFERALQEGGLEIRNITERKNVSMYITNRQCETVGPFECPLVVSMRPFPSDQVAKAAEITANFPASHGPPVHHGDASTLGIPDLAKPDFGDPVTIKEGEQPVFWPCGVTSSLAALSAKLDLVITHSPGCMFVTDLPDK
ncbi:Hydro-lyase [Balamuthia mandrillaris]